MRTQLSRAAVVVALCLCGCAGPRGSEVTPAQTAIHSEFTSLQPAACQQKVGQNDPNDTPYLACPGIGGYTLHVRKVESGRISLDVVDPGGQARPLNLQDTVTRSMTNLTGQAEWRVPTGGGGGALPVALIVRVEVREDDGDPEKVTQTYVTVAKITADAACVTDRIPEGAQPAEKVLAAADTARQRPCVSPLPERNAGGPERH
ncbi:MAG: hypothetical protein QM757_06345 [Paludibaculum sp.]